MIRRSLTLAGGAALSMALSACALLSSPDPIQMYRFGQAAEPVRAAPGAMEIQLRRVEFNQAAGDDRILGVTGAEVAYIGGARWVERASLLYQESIENAFAAEATQVRLAGRRELSPSPRILDLDVRTFEARYPAPGAAPTVRVSIRARLISREDRELAAEEVFTVERPAGANRVSAIVEAFDQAVAEANSAIIDWTEASAR